MVKTTISVTLLLFFFLFYSNPVYAHRMIIENPEPGTIRVIYDGEIPAVRSTLQLWGSEEQLVYEGPVDSRGYFTYDDELSIYKVIARDDFGHKEVFILGEEKKDVNRFRGAFIGVSILLIIAAVFQAINNRNKNIRLNIA